MTQTETPDPSFSAGDTAHFSGRLKYLDSLRGLAAMTVVLQHIVEGILRHTLVENHIRTVLEILFRYCFNWGRFGVVLFFLLSGFVIPFSLRGPSAIRKFVIRRLFRLYPAYWFSLILAVLAGAFVTGQQFFTITILANLTMLQEFTGKQNVVPAYWTLSVEILFYLLCALVYYKSAPLRPTTVVWTIAANLAIAMIFVAIGQVFHRHFPLGLPLHIALMFFGTTLRQASFENSAFAKEAIPKLLVVFAVVIPCTQFFSIIKDDANSFDNPTAFTAAYFLALAVFMFSVQRRSFVGPVSGYLGKISYSIYLVHGIVLSVAAPLLMLTPPWGAAAFAVTVFISTIAISILSFHLIERPAMDWGAKLAGSGLKSQRQQPA